MRITSASNLIAVYIGTSEMKLSKEHKRICFGGKKITKDDAYNIAKQFVAELKISDKLIKDSIMVGNRWLLDKDVVSPIEKNSVNTTMGYKYTPL